MKRQLHMRFLASGTAWKLLVISLFFLPVLLPREGNFVSNSPNLALGTVFASYHQGDVAPVAPGINPLARLLSPLPQPTTKLASSIDKPTPTVSASVASAEYVPPAPPAPVWYQTSYPYGQCTYWVSLKRSIPWTGNAWQWFSLAQAYGLATGYTPRVGAIYVGWDNGTYGHVAYVESVSPGSYVISEMNATMGWGQMDYRTIVNGTAPLIGFIY